MAFVGDVRLITVLNHGKHAYVLNPLTGKNPRFDTGSEAFYEALQVAVSAGHAERVQRQLGSFARDFPDQCWASVLGRLRGEGSLPA